MLRKRIEKARKEKGNKGGQNYLATQKMRRRTLKQEKRPKQTSPNLLIGDWPK